MSNAKLAWNSYVIEVGGTTFDGKQLPEWEELGERQKDGWQAATRAVEQSTLLKVIEKVSEL